MYFYQNITKSDPIFKIGDEVEFEIALGTNYARWDYFHLENINNDGGASGIWAKGIVVDPADILLNMPVLASQWIYISFEIEGMIGAGSAAFPNKTNIHYNEYQWPRQGYLRKI